MHVARGAIFCEREGAIEVRLRVTPNASKDEIAGLWTGPEGDRRLAVRVTAPPDKGKANKAVVKLFAKALALPKSAVLLTAGQKDRLKTVAIVGACDQTAAKLELIITELGSGEFV